jgi:ABC-type lipoprotein export system ATPase subunit
MPKSSKIALLTDLVIPSGEMLVLLGPSGSGKSALLNILGGLDRATSGSVRFRGLDTDGGTVGQCRVRKHSSDPRGQLAGGGSGHLPSGWHSTK